MLFHTATVVIIGVLFAIDIRCDHRNFNDAIRDCCVGQDHGHTWCERRLGVCISRGFLTQSHILFEPLLVRSLRSRRRLEW